MPLLAGGHQRGGEWTLQEKESLVIFFIFALQATALDMLAAFDEDVQYMYMLNVVYVLRTTL